METVTEKTAEQHVGVLIDPEGNRFYARYGPMTEKREDAMRYVSPQAALRSANYYLGIDTGAFWESERKYAEDAKHRYRGWRAESELA